MAGEFPSSAGKDDNEGDGSCMIFRLDLYHARTTPNTIHRVLGIRAHNHFGL
jgi:hypothetical protein